MNPSPVNILVVDDDPDILEFVGYNLEKEGYHVTQASSGVEALNLAKTLHPHLILLDIMMPEMDGITACHKIRAELKFKDTLIAFLTARHEEYSEIAGFDAGADDYILKPISPRILTSRVKALLRRHKTDSKPEEKIVRLNQLMLDKEKYEVHLENQPIDLAKKEFEILWLLVSKPGKVYTREEIYHKIWGSEVLVGTRTIDVHISKIRNKLQQKYIRTLKGIGYKVDL